jgi:hypothetical protein
MSKLWLKCKINVSAGLTARYYRQDNYALNRYVFLPFFWSVTFRRHAEKARPNARKNCLYSQCLIRLRLPEFGDIYIRVQYHSNTSKGRAHIQSSIPQLTIRASLIRYAVSLRWQLLGWSRTSRLFHRVRRRIPWHLRPAWRRLQRLVSSGMWRRVVWYRTHGVTFHRQQCSLQCSQKPVIGPHPLPDT